MSRDQPVKDPTRSVERDLSAWLESVGADDTLVQERASTIVPPSMAPHSIAGRRALALLQELAGVPPGATAQLRQGTILGEGGMGVVRQAEQVALGRTVAVKTLKPGKNDERAVLDLLREAWVTGAIEHPNVVPVHYLGLDEEGRPLIVLKRIEGVEWSELVDDAEAVRVRFGATDLLAWNLGILLQVLNAMRYAHSRGVIHRDLKPGNVMIGEFGEVYLLDWGIAVSLHDDGSGRMPLAADAVELAGTPSFMAPEMLAREGDPPLSERTDVYLAGAVLFTLITGRPPHQGRTAAEIITSVITSRPELPASVPAELARICLHAMDPDPALRYASADAMRLALLGYLEHRGSGLLAERAHAQLDELLALLAAAPADADLAREQIHRAFGACRFGFHEALAAWRDNDDARAGLARATVAVAEYELASNAPGAAVSLLSELRNAPPELLVRARAAATAQEQRRIELERVHREHDIAIGTRTRVFVSALLGVLFTTLPLLGLAFPDAAARFGHGHHVAMSASYLTLLLGLGWWARASMLKTAINRRTFATGVLLFVSQILLCLGCWRLDIPPVQVQVLVMALWMAISGMLAIAIDPRLAPSAVGFGLAFGFAALWPAHRFYAIAASNLVFTVNAVWHWRPERLLVTDDERRALGWRSRRRS